MTAAVDMWCLGLVISLDPAKAIHDRAARHAVDGDVGEATALYEQALAIRRADPTQKAEVTRTLHNLATLYDLSGQHERAAELWAEAQKVAGELRTAEVGE